MTVEIIRRFRPGRALIRQSWSRATFNSLRRHGAALSVFDTALIGLVVVRVAHHLRHGHIHEVPCLQHLPFLHVVFTLHFCRWIAFPIIVKAVTVMRVQTVSTDWEPCIGWRVNQVLVNHVSFLRNACGIRHDEMIFVPRGWVHAQWVGVLRSIASQSWSDG